MKVPIENLYYLLIYAWNALKEADIVAVNPRDYTRLADLFARVLLSGVAHLIKRGLDRGYLARQEPIPGIRGKINISASVKTRLLSQARAVCEYDELSHNVPHNQIVKSTMRELLRIPHLDFQLRDAIKGICRRLHEISDIQLTSQTFRLVQIHHSISFYRFLLDVCQLIHNNLLIDETTGIAKFRDFVRDEETMARIFEKFVRNFYHHEQTIFKVRSEHFRWQETTGSEYDLRFLPMMTTDISLESAERKIVIETKYYRNALVQHHGKELVRSEHLYQLFAYLENLSSINDSKDRLEGILLYPTVSKTLNLYFKVHGHNIRVCTINLNQDWRYIHRDMLQLLAIGSCDYYR